MKQIILEQLILINFKGIRELMAKFNETEQIIKGKNATGKTTLADGFLWLLFGKDSTDRKDFEIKTLDANNKVIEKLDHEVAGIIRIDGKRTTLRRVLREKWTKRRGSEETEFTGNETLFFVDEVPMQAGEYSRFISSIIDENLFKMITNPEYFNSLHWEKRRAIITELAGETSDEEIASTRVEFQALMAELSGKSFEDFKKMVAAKKKILKDELIIIPTRIDEVNRQMPQSEPDYKQTEAQIRSNEAEIFVIDEQIADRIKRSQSNFDLVKAKQKELNDLQTKIADVEYGIEKEVARHNQAILMSINAIDDQTQNFVNKGNILKKDIESTIVQLNTMESYIGIARTKWTAVNSTELVFNENEFRCPTCLREFDPSQIEQKKAELTENFNADKIKKLVEISAEGKRLSDLKKDTESLLADYEKQINELTEKVKANTEKVNELKSAPTSVKVVDYNQSEEWKSLKKQISEFKMPASGEAVNVDDLKAKKDLLRADIDSLKNSLNTQQIINSLKSRIAVLEADMKVKSQALADLEKQEFVMEQFDKCKMDKVEEKANRMFTMVKFKMFNTLINGGIEPTCETLIHGVPWSDANRAGRMQGGLDIINTLCEKYQVYAPIWIDNAESCLIYPEIKSQTIKLHVTEDEKLTFV